MAAEQPGLADARDALATIEAVRAVCRAADGQDPLDEAATLHLKRHGLDGLGDDAVAVAEQGFALVLDGELLLAVAPDARGRGLGGDLAARVVRGADRAWSHGDAPAAARLAERHGFARTRDLWVMRRPSTEPLPPLAVPDGVTVRGFRDADADQVLAVNATAFASHPEQGALDADGLAARMAEPWWDPAGLLLAVDDATGDLLGFHWTKRHSDVLGEVYVVAVGPAAQGRGLGKVLTLAGLHHLVDGGADEVLLYVESDNAPALAVYSGLGFTHAAHDTHVQYTR